MKKLALAAALLLAPLAVAAPARAGVLTSATLVVEVRNFPAASFTGSTAVAGAPSDTQVFLGAGSAFAGAVTTTAPTNAAPPISGFQFTMGPNQGGSFTGTTPGNVGGKASFPVGVCAQFGSLCLLDLTVPFGVTTTFTAPVGPGIAGTFHAKQWTAGTTMVALTSPTSQGASVATRQGSNGLDSLGRGSLVLVSGVNIVTGAFGQLPTFGTLTLNFVPEPGTGLLLLAAAGGILARRPNR